MRGGADRLPASVFPRMLALAPLKNRFSVQIRGIRLALRGPFLFNRHFAPNIISLARRSVKEQRRQSRRKET